MANRDLLKEAIADAKAVKETAIANAKAALEEAFTPLMQEKFAMKIAEMDKEEELEEAYEVEEGEEKEMQEMYDVEEAKAESTDSMEEGELDLEELLRELDELEEGGFGKFSSEGTEGFSGEEDGEKKLQLKALDEAEGETEETEEEEIDIENMDEDDLKSFIESVIADMVAAGELEGNIEGGEKSEEEESEEEEVEIKETEMKTEEKMEEIVGGGTDFLDLADKLGISIDAAKYLVVAGGLAVPAILAAIKVGGDKAIQFFKKAAMKKAVAETEETKEMEEMKSELEEAYNTIKTIKEELSEVNLFNAKLLYTNKIFKSKNLTESQKVKVLAAFDKAASVKEAKLVFETLSEGFKEKKSPVNESLLRSSASKVAGVAEKKPILEVNDQFARWQTLAGIKK